MTVKEIERIIKEAKTMKHTISVKDISYVILFFEYSSASIAYKSIFDKNATDETINDYDKSKRIDFLKSYYFCNFKEVNIEQSLVQRKVDSSSDITFEENKAELLSLIAAAKKGYEDGQIELKEYLVIEKDIRIKLNDKFNMSSENDQNLVIVETKFNSICPYCNREIYVPSKTDLMKKYNLIEK